MPHLHALSIAILVAFAIVLLGLIAVAVYRDRADRKRQRESMRRRVEEACERDLADHDAMQKRVREALDSSARALRGGAR